MLKLLKMDYKLHLSDRYSLLRYMLFIGALLGFAVELGFMDIVIVYVPIFIVLYNSIVPNIKESIVTNYSMIQSLPVKRWEYVTSNYIATLLKHGIFIIYMILVLRLLNILGFSSLEYIRVILSKKTMVMWLVTYVTVIPITFMIFGAARNFFSIIIVNFMRSKFEYGEEGIINFLVENLDNIKSTYLILLILVVSMGISIFVYSKRDLR